MHDRMGFSFVTVLILVGTSLVSLSGGMPAVHFFHYPIPIAVPAMVAHWRVATDGFHFQAHDTADGSYHFGYAAGTGTGKDESYREERRDASGRVSGRYGYVDPTGILRTVEYFADQHGFRSRSSDHVILDNSNVQLIGPIPKPVQLQVIPATVQVQEAVVQPSAQPPPQPPQQARQATSGRRFRNKEIKVGAAPP